MAGWLSRSRESGGGLPRGRKAPAFLPAENATHLQAAHKATGQRLVLDGFPRTAAQAGMLESLAERQRKKLSAILIDVPQDLLEKRMTGRRSCPVCGEIYNIYFKPPRLNGKCDDHPEVDLIHRADDTEENVRVRLETYNRETAPLLQYYSGTGRLHRVDGTRPPDEIHAEIRRIVNGDHVSTATL